MCKKDNESKLTKEGIFAINTDYYEKLQSIDSDMYLENKNGPISPKEYAFYNELKSQERITGLVCPDGYTYYTIAAKAKEAYLCLDFGLYGAALQLALTLPDTCGAIAYAHFGKAEVRNRYEKWFDEYVIENGGPDGKALADNGFTGEKCYCLRNKILHENTTSGYDFKLTISNASGKIIDNKHMLIDIGIPIICSAILEGVGNFIQLDYPAPQDYKTYGYKIFSTVASIESLKKVTDYFDNKDDM